MKDSFASISFYGASWAKKFSRRSLVNNQTIQINLDFFFNDDVARAYEGNKRIKRPGRKKLMKE